MKKIYTLIIIVMVSVNLVRAQQDSITIKPLIMLDGKELTTPINEINPDSIDNIQRIKNNFMEVLFGERGAKGVTLVSLKNDFPRNIGFDIPQTYLDRCSGKVSIGDRDSLYSFNASEAKTILSLIPTEYIKNVSVVLFQSANRKQESKYRKDSVLKITLKEDDNDVDSIKFYEVYMPYFKKGMSNTRDFATWVMHRVNSFYDRPDGNRIFPYYEGEVVAEFRVMHDGSIGDINIKYATNQDFADKVRMALESSPRWTPGIINGKPGSLKYVIPVKFRSQTQW